jgi:long-chain acyl-CoA synthetase
MTHSQIRENAGRIASGLASLGVANGDRTALLLRNDLVFPQIITAAGILGAVAVPINWHWKRDEIRYVLKDSGSKVVFAHADLADVIEGALPRGAVLIVAGSGGLAHTQDHRLVFEDWVAAQDSWDGPPALAPNSMIYTSGTTGRPKGVVREQAPPHLVQERLRVVLEAFALERGMRTLIPAPLYHTAPLIHLTFALRAGVDTVIMPKFDAEELLQLVEEHQVEHVHAVPTMFIRLLQLEPEQRERYDLSSLRAVVHGAAACPPDVKHAMISWLGPILHEYYGGTEFGIVVGCNSEEWLTHPGTVGKPLADAAIRVVNDEGYELPPGSVGHLYLKPPTCQPSFSYHGQAAAAAEIIRDGYVSIGDVGYVDTGGYVYITDRAADMVISGGVNIYPAEIEQCLVGLSGVRDCAVFGIPDPEFGERLVAHVQLLPGADVTEDDVRSYLRGALAGYKVPRQIVFDPDLPRDDSGKLVKRRLRARYLVDASEATASPTRRRVRPEPTESKHTKGRE